MTSDNNITSLLVSPNAKVRLEAVQQLQQSDIGALSALGVALGDADRRVCEVAIEKLVSFKGNEPIKTLMLALADERDWLRDAVDTALRNINERWETTPAAQSFIDEFFLELAFLDSPLHQKATESVDRPDDQLAAAKLRDAIIEHGAESLSLILERRGDTSELTPMLRLLSSSDPADRKLSFETLNLLNPFWAELKAARVLASELAPDLKSIDLAMRVATIQVFAAIAEPDSIPILIDCLNDEGYVRSTAEAALNRLEPEWTQRPEIGRLVESCIARLQSEQPTARYSALQTLRRVGTEEVAPEVAKALVDENPRVRREASACLEGFTTDWKKNKLSRLAVPIAIEALDHANEDIRRDAQTLLGEIGGRPAVKALLDRLAVEPEAGLIKALGAIGDARALEPLIAMLLHGSAFLHSHTVNALQAIDPQWTSTETAKGFVPELIGALRNGDEDGERAAAARGIGELGDEACIDPLRTSAASDSSPDVRLESVKALEKLRKRIWESQAAG